MKSSEIIEKARRLEVQRERLAAKDRARRVLGFLAAKGLLYCPGVDACGGVKLTIADCLWAGARVEPRILEVLPAAVMRFPRAFIDRDRMPADLVAVVAAIRRDLLEGPDFREMAYGALKHWADALLADRRGVPVNQKRRIKSFRLEPAAIKLLEVKAAQAGLSQTEYIEKLIRADSRSVDECSSQG